MGYGMLPQQLLWSGWRAEWQSAPPEGSLEAYCQVGLGNLLNVLQNLAQWRRDEAASHFFMVFFIVQCESTTWFGKTALMEATERRAQGCSQTRCSSGCNCFPPAPLHKHASTQKDCRLTCALITTSQRQNVLFRGSGDCLEEIISF